MPSHIKEPVVYMRWEKSGSSGGNCWGGHSTYYENSDERDYHIFPLYVTFLTPFLISPIPLVSSLSNEPK